jgi:hypothetical protein
VRVWDAVTGQELLTLKGHTSWVSSVSFSPDGQRLASAGDDMTVRLWDAVTGKEVLTLKGHTNAVSGVSFSPDGQRLASAGADMTVRVWVAASGQELLTLKGHTDRVVGLGFSPDGRRLVSAGDTTVRVWEGLAVPDAVWRQRGLVSHVDSLFRNLLLRKEVLAALRKDPTLDEADREFAVQVANTRLEDFGVLNSNAWNLVRHREGGKGAYVRALSLFEPAVRLAPWHAGKDTYAHALSLSEAAVRLAPGDGMALNTLGVAQYRTGRYAVALATLTKSEKLNANKEGSLPADLAFLAMAQHQLGKKDEAKATLDRLRKVMKQPRWVNDSEATGFLREAEELIEGKPAGKGQ